MRRSSVHFTFIIGLLIAFCSTGQVPPNYADPYNTLGNPANPNTTPQSQYNTQQPGVITAADTTEDDTTGKVKEHFGFRNNPFVASIASAVFPGLGQLYNGKLWKAPLFWSILGTLGYYVYTNNNQYRDFRSAFIYLDEKDPTTFNDISREEATRKYNEIKATYASFMLPFDTAANSNAAQLMAANRDFSRRNRDWVAVFFLLGYICNIMDASVDAHFAHFDVSDKLSMKIEPSFISQSGKPQIGINLNLTFTDNRRKVKDFRLKTED